MAGTVFGIDLGTTYSCISQIDDYGRPEVLRNFDSEPTTPSVVLFDSADDYTVGKQAKRQARINPDNVAALVKRRMGDPDWRFLAPGWRLHRQILNEKGWRCWIYQHLQLRY